MHAKHHICAYINTTTLIGTVHGPYNDDCYVWSVSCSA